MNSKFIFIVFISSVNALLPANGVVDLKVEPSIEAYEKIVEETIEKDANNLAPVKAYLARVKEMHGRVGLVKLLNGDISCLPLAASLSTYSNRRLFKLELENGANAALTDGRKTFEQQAELLDTVSRDKAKRENTTFNEREAFLPCVARATLSTRLLPFLIQAKSGISPLDVSSNLRRHFVNDATVNEDLIKELLEEAIVEADKEKRGLTDLLRAYKGELVDESGVSYPEEPATSSSGSSKVLLVVAGGAGSLVLAAIGLKLLNATVSTPGSSSFSIPGIN